MNLNEKLYLKGLCNKLCDLFVLKVTMASELPEVVKIICFAKKDSDGPDEELPAQDPLEVQDWEPEPELEVQSEIVLEPEQIGLEQGLECDPFQLDQAPESDIELISPELVQEPEDESDSEIKSEQDSDIKSEIKSEFDSEQESGSESGSNFSLEADLQSETESELDPDPLSDWEPDCEPKRIRRPKKKPLKVSSSVKPKSKPVAPDLNNRKRKFGAGFESKSNAAPVQKRGRWEDDDDDTDVVVDDDRRIDNRRRRPAQPTIAMTQLRLFYCGGN